MTTLKLTSNGLSTGTQAEIVEQLQIRIQDVFGTNTNVSASSIMGQLINIVAELQALDQQVLLAVYRKFDPNSAIGVALDSLAAITGSVRRGATNSVVNGLATFSAAGTLNNGDLIQNDDNNTQWQLINGPVVAGGAGDFAATFQAVDTGPLLANSGTTWSIVTVVANFSGFANATDDATIGANQESDLDFRVRRQTEIYSQNIGPLLSIQGVVSKVDTANGSVTNVRVYHNPSISPADTNGIPFKAFEVVVRTDPALPDPQVAGPIEPLAQDVADAIFSATGAGGESFGVDYGVVAQIDVTDVEGQAQGPILFSLFKTVNIFIDINITLFTNNQDGPIVPEEPSDMASLIRSTVATTLTESFVIIGRDARALDTQGIIQVMIVSGQLSGVASATVGVGLTASPDLTIDSVALAAGTGSDFTTSSVHNFSIGTIVVHSGFVNNPDYNGVFTVTAIPSTLVYEVAAITFASTDAGIATEQISDLTATVTLRQEPDYDSGNIRVFIDGVES